MHAATVPNALSPRSAVALVAAFVTMNVTGALLAMAMNPLVATSFGDFMRDPQREGLHLPALLGGYAVLALVLGTLLVGANAQSVRRGAALGLLLGLGVFFAGHLVVAGWSRMPAGAMALSGLIDALAVAAGGVVFVAVRR